MEEAYFDREQTAAKHFILRHYLEGLATITLGGSHGFHTLTYVDGFSGPWQSRDADYSDTSFMIAIRVLKSVQQKMHDKGSRRIIKCFFVEKRRAPFVQLQAAVTPYHDPASGFQVRTYHGRFEDSVPHIIDFLDGFALTFIDPTGWTEYPFDRIGSLLRRQPGEVLVNFMYDFAARFTSWDDAANQSSFDGILRAGWPERIDRSLPPGMAVEKLFRDEFRDIGCFEHVVSSPIKRVEDRVQFCITFGTRHKKGLEVYRSVEQAALRQHDFRRFEARQARTVASSGQDSLFTAAQLYQNSTLESESAAEKTAACEWLEKRLRKQERPVLFGDLWPELLEAFVLTKSDAKNVVCELADRGVIQPTWRAPGSRRRKPNEGDLICVEDGGE